MLIRIELMCLSVFCLTVDVHVIETVSAHYTPGIEKIVPRNVI